MALVPGGDDQRAEPDDLRQAMHDPLRRARVHQAVRQSVRQAQPALDFAQAPASHLATTAGRRQSEQPQPCPEPVTDPEETA
jgi:hypothetical protein